MSSAPLPHQQSISGTYATNGSQTFAGVVHGNIYYGARECAPQAPPKPLSTVPFRRDRDFVHRGDILTQIDQRCSQPAGRAALVGLGGVGKSQLAIEYSYRVRERSPQTWVFWVHASNTARFEAAYKNIADILRLPGRDDTTVNVLQLVFNWLCSEACERWLMVIDNADDKSVFDTERQDGQRVGSSGTRKKLTLASLLPQSHNGSIVITSRNRDLAVKLTGRDKDVILVDTLTREQGLKLLQNKLLCPLDESASGLLAALGDIPLAVAQAAAYINKNWPRTTVASYAQDFNTSDKRREELLSQAAIDLGRDEEASNSILTAWQISFERIREEKPSAANLLSFMSFFNPQGIPDFILRGHLYQGQNTVLPLLQRLRQNKSLGFHKLGKAIRSLRSDNNEDEFRDDVDLLKSYSLVTINLSGDVVQMHRLVQFATRTWLRSFNREDRWRQKFLATLSEAFPTGNFNHWSQCQLLLPHAESIVNQEPVDAKEAKWWAQILFNAAWYISTQGKYGEAEQMNRRALEGREKALGKEHLHTLKSVNNLAAVLWNQGRYDKAEQMSRRALERMEKALGKEHSHTLASVNNLAAVLWSQGKYGEAEQMNRRALEGMEKALGKEHPHTLTSVNNLARVLRGQGKYDEVEQMNRRALEGREKALGKEHPHTLASVNDLAAVLRDQGKYDEVEQMNRRALEGREKALGKEHPDTLTSVNNLARVLLDQGKYDEAEQMNRRALKGYEKALGREHPHTLTSVNNLAAVLRDQGKYDKAEQMNRRALEGYEKALGKEHLHTLKSVNNLAAVMWNQGRYGEAEQINRRALEGMEKALGKEHPHTLMSVNNLARVLRDQGKYNEAEQMNRRALEGTVKALGKEHLDTLISINDLAVILQD